MAEQKKGGWGGTVLGWFVEFDESEKKPDAPATPAPKKGAGSDDAADDLIRRYASDGPGAKGASAKAADGSPAKSPSGEKPPDFGGGAKSGIQAPTVTPGAIIDFDSVFKSAGIAEAERDRVKKALELLAALPAETPQPIKKQIVETSLKTFGVSIDSIIETAVAEIQALHGAIQAGANDAQKLLGDSQSRIAKLEQQISDVKQIVRQKQEEQASLEGQARSYGLRVQQILEFFGQEKVAQIVKESPRLVDPTGPNTAAPAKK